RRPRAIVGMAVVCQVLLLGGCQLTPPHERPPMPVAQAYPADYQPGPIDGIRARDLGWAEFLVDERLRVLVGTALARNRDLAEAVAQIEEARGVFGVQRADRVPTL